ncbi:uncharacterized protein LOC120015645 [Tripterygium wilfordii]|uniref:uncharacterized protein LOC120015645 n=1 Tax=Tripterygium wilfordii TaxID=458696 RepID=UPI0018F828F0|nr:uncharacterized protein LOC120015645 [Tripterygium wilfordii]
MVPSSGVKHSSHTSVGFEKRNHEDSDGFDTWFDDDPYVLEPPLHDLNLDNSPVRVVDEQHDEFFSTATSPPRVKSVTPTHTTASLGKRSSHMSGCQIRKKRATTKVDTMNELVQAVHNVAGKLNSPSHDSSIGYGGGQSQYGIATVILKKMMHDQHMSTELYLFAVDLLRDNMNSEFFIDCDDALRMPFIERKFDQYKKGTNVDGL